MENKVSSFTDLIVWKKAHQFVLDVYRTTKNFPQEEKFGLIDQLRRAAVSITSNIAEGFYRRTKQDKKSFYTISLASNGEIQNQLLIGRDLHYISSEQFHQLAVQSIEIRKLLLGLINSAQTKN